MNILGGGEIIAKTSLTDPLELRVPLVVKAIIFISLAL